MNGLEKVNITSVEVGRGSASPTSPNDGWQLEDFRDTYNPVQQEVFPLDSVPFPGPELGREDFTFIDLFAGIGGFRMAMQNYGGRCVFSSEFDKFAQKTYFANYGEVPFGDITKDETKAHIPMQFDVLCAGFPCQPFSHAGLKKGFGDTRGTLFFSIEEILLERIDAAQRQDNERLIPRVLFLENVKGLRGHDQGRTFATIQAKLEELGYEVRAEVLNSKYFGLPQNRERIFIVAWYKNLVKAEDFKFPWGLDKSGHSIFDRDDLDKLCKQVSVGDILLSDTELNRLEKEAGRTYTISERLWAGHLRRRKEHKEKGNGFGYSMFTDDSPYTSTISARYYKDGSEILIDQSLLGKRPRKLHPIEAASLQGYPVERADANGSFIIPVSDAQAYKQFGNSVSVPVIKAIAKEIVNQLLN